jgi:hypothetical protein
VANRTDLLKKTGIVRRTSCVSRPARWMRFRPHQRRQPSDGCRHTDGRPAETGNGQRSRARGEEPGEESFGAIRDGGIYIPVRGWGDKPAERGIKIKPMMVSGVLERTEWLELLRNMVAAGEIKLRVVEEYAPTKAADAQRALVAGNPLLATLPPCRPGHSIVQFRAQKLDDGSHGSHGKQARQNQTRAI